jgi:cytochrome P450
MSTPQDTVKFQPPGEQWPGDAVQEFLTQTGSQPVVRAELPDGSLAWLVCGYEETRRVVVDPVFSRALAVTPDRALQSFEVAAASTLNGMDPPEHTRLRKLVSSAFTPRRVEALRPRVAAIVADLIDGLAGQPQPVDLAGRFSWPLPVAVICEMLGVPTDHMAKFRQWTEVVLGDWQREADQIMVAMAEMYGYFGQLIAMKRDAPADDLLSALIAARDEEDRLSEEELAILGCALLIAGHETTANQINLSLVALLDRPAEIEALRADPARIPAAVEELLRFVPLSFGITPARVATRDVELGGVMIRDGDVVMPMYAVANRDHSAFSAPDQFDIAPRMMSHLAFGAGPHHCLGAQLARMELQEALKGLLARLPGLRLAVPAGELQLRPGLAIHSLREFPVYFDAPA